MKPRLVTLSGPRKGDVFPVEEKITIGREPASTVHISDVAISRQHCLINQGKLFDLDSLNGTFVNEVPVKERVLQHADRIVVGSSQFLYLLDEGQEPTSVELRDDGPQLSTIFLKDEAFASDALWKFSSEIHRLRKTTDLQRRMMELIFEAIPAQRGAVLFAEDSVEEFSTVFTWNRTAGQQAKVRISRTVANLVLSKGESVLSNDAPKSFQDSQSLAEAGTGSVLGAPVYISEKVKGLIYLEAPGTSAFSEQDLRLLSAMAAIASLAFENLQHLEWLVEENRNLRNKNDGQSGILGESPKIQEILKFIHKASATDSTVVILGESGTGKELVARALHEKSSRSNQPFVAINCAALTESLLESELFGHERGAFTGAIAQKKGKFEIADGGTLFLDEITELTPSLQAKLLRVLQERTFERVGGTHPIRVNIRVLAATNRNLKEAIKDGTFREDLYYRLNVLAVQIPPLRDRAGDIPLLATYFASRFGLKFQKRILGISPEARTRLMNYHWPGNVRELENAIERAVVLGNSEQILPEDLPESLLESGTAGNLSKYHEGVQETKKQLILNAVENAGGNFTEAAKLLGVHPNYLHRLIRNLDLRELIKKAEMPEQLGHYRILKKIGEGGMGEVFCAEDLKLGRNVALKILPAQFAEDARRLGRFLREARLASTLSHPNVTHIYEVGEENGVHFIAMEYVQGETLQERIKNGPLDNSALLKVAQQIAEALQSAHAAGIIHRDVKPANIMVNSSEHVKILDFGLAKQEWSERRDVDHLSTEAQTQTGTLLGTVHYMSPEQALGKQVDQRSDIFSFGAVLYEMATGKRAFQGPNVTATIAQILATQPQSAIQLNPRLQDAVNRIIEKCLRKDPKERYQTLKDAMLDLSSAGESGPAQAVLYESEKEYSLPRGLARAFFIALQGMYVAFYVCALKWNDAMEMSFADLLGPAIASYLMVAYILTGILGIAIRLHMIFLVMWDHVSAGVQFRKIFPVIFALDAFWAFAPFGLLRKISGILLMACVPPLVFSPFSQRTLMRSAYDLHANRRV